MLSYWCRQTLSWGTPAIFLLVSTTKGLSRIRHWGWWQYELCRHSMGPPGTAEELWRCWKAQLVNMPTNRKQWLPCSFLSKAISVGDCPQPALSCGAVLHMEMHRPQCFLAWLRTEWTLSPIDVHNLLLFVHREMVVYSPEPNISICHTSCNLQGRI